ncbi:hypothetical protein PhCBS80983_g04256 [Powellomyces hirtus]|uniref:Protein kinase domain-containing protein n=1 Tax=Powellomyces hirtus TaxID=109895 RepID=A0A507DZ59_9FUNG|nr:hypothetical protein PhCBS80983_g04256 [Powellomyces hirtus]
MGVACCKEEPIDFTQEVELNHFHLLRSVGKGAFGKVRVVQHKGTQAIYALKYINKAKCIKMRAVENIIQERRLLEEVELSVCLDDENLFMILDLMLGGDLRFHLDRMGMLKESMVKFYTAEVACGLAYLHSKKIVHRDLKPDNVLLDEKGHAHLTDFNIAVHYREEKPLTAVAGSMAYMAPEVLNKKGYFSSVDWWSLGVLSYEMAFGKRPFRAKTNEALTEAILTDELEFPGNARDLVSSDCVDVLKDLLNRDITKRLGCPESGGQERFRALPWFKGYIWEDIEKKEGTPPFVPDAKRANFDATHELEELLLEDNPLKAKPRKKKKEGEEDKPKEGEDPAVTRDMRIMEEKFKLYDFTKTRKALPTQSLTMGAIMNMPGSIPGPPASETSMHRDVMEGRDDGVDMTGVEEGRESRVVERSRMDSDHPPKPDVAAIAARRAGGNSPTKSK